MKYKCHRCHRPLCTDDDLVQIMPGYWVRLCDECKPYSDDDLKESIRQADAGELIPWDEARKEL